MRNAGSTSGSTIRRMTAPHGAPLTAPASSSSFLICAIPDDMSDESETSTGEDLGHAAGATEVCEAACYDCLLSYGNQRDHRLLDRKKIAALDALVHLLGDEAQHLARQAEAKRERLRSALSYPEGSVGALMDFDHVAVREDVTLEAATRYLRRFDELPDHTDQLFVVDREQRLIGALPLARLIVSDLELPVSRVMLPEAMRLEPLDDAEDAAGAFERYDLVSAPVVDAEGRLMGRLTVDAVVDHIRQRNAESRLAEAGLQHEEDVFATVLDSFRNRWAWLAVNLVTALVASRVIGAFEDSIAQLVALAALMPIVAGIGGNSGNQTVTMIVRALALGQIQGGYWLKLLRKETGVALLNGAVWGTLAALRRMKPRDRGCIVQVGSALAYRSIPLQSAYCGAKAAIRGFTDALRCELRHQGSDVHLTMVQLPGVNTPQFDWIRAKLRGRPRPIGSVYQPEVAAKATTMPPRLPARTASGWPGLRRNRRRRNRSRSPSPARSWTSACTCIATPRSCRRPQSWRACAP